MKNAQKIVILIVLAIMLLTVMAPVYAAEDTANSLPLDTLKQGGLNDSSMGGTAVVAPFIKIINSIIGFLAALLLAYAIFHLVLRIKAFIAGKKNLQGFLMDLGELFLAIVCLAISITGSWYDLINWFYVTVIQNVLAAF
jgi:hypothetical protein